MPNEEALSDRRDRFRREAAILLGTPTEAIQTWDEFLRAEQTAIGLQHDATDLKAKYRVDFARQSVDVNSGSPLQVQQEFMRTAALITEFRQKLVGVKERLQARSGTRAESDEEVIQAAKAIGMSKEEAAAYLKMSKRIDAVDPTYGPARRAAAKIAIEIDAAHRDFDKVLEKTRETPFAKIGDEAINPLKNREGRGKRMSKAEVLALLAKSPELALNRSELSKRTGWSRETFSRGKEWPETLRRFREILKSGRLAEEHENRGRRVSRKPPKDPEKER